MKNGCIEREKLFALSQRMLSEIEQPEVQSHLESCEKCSRVLQSYQQLDSVLSEWSPEAEPSPWFDARVRAAAAERKRRPLLGLNWARWMAAPALASLLLVSGIVMLLHRPAERAPQNVATVPVSSVQTAQGPVTQAQTASQELKMYQNLPVLEDYDMLTNFDVISELPKGSHKIAD